MEIPWGFCPSGLWDFNAAGVIRMSRVEMSHFAFLFISSPEIGMGKVLHLADLSETCLTTRIEYRVGEEICHKLTRDRKWNVFVSNRKSEYFENLERP